MKGRAFLAVGLVAWTTAASAQGPEYRRVVTGFSEEGRAVVVSDGAPEAVSFDALPGYQIVPMWSTGPTPVISRSGEAPEYRPGSFVPEPGGTQLAMVRWPSREEMAKATENPALMEELTAEMTVTFPDLIAATSAENPALHATATVDYVIIVSGTVIMELDDGATVTLNAGDVVIQNGTPHAWYNGGEEAAVMAAVLVGADGP